MGLDGLRDFVPFELVHLASAEEVQAVLGSPRYLRPAASVAVADSSGRWRRLLPNY